MNVRRIDVAVASPGDVRGERDAVLRIFARWNTTNDHAMLNSIMWEHAAVPALGNHPQAILNTAIIDRSELLIAILWSKLGTPTPTARSGTVEEIREFVKLKGAERVMIYFCTRDLPHDIDATDLVKLREFKAEIKSQGLYHEYKTVDEFERDLYRHLDVKVQDLLAGKFPLPEPATLNDSNRGNSARLPADSRLHQPIDFGTTLQSIAGGFATRMAEFRAIDGVGPNKFFDLGSHVFDSVATCLDRFLTYSAADIDQPGRRVLNDLSARLKRLSASSTEYLKKPFPQFWIDGEEISRDLSAHVHHLNQLKRN